MFGSGGSRSKSLRSEKSKKFVEPYVAQGIRPKFYREGEGMFFSEVCAVDVGQNLRTVRRRVAAATTKEKRRSRRRSRHPEIRNTTRNLVLSTKSPLRPRRVP